MLAMRVLIRSVLGCAGAIVGVAAGSGCALSESNAPESNGNVESVQPSAKIERLGNQTAPEQLTTDAEPAAVVAAANLSGETRSQGDAGNTTAKNEASEEVAQDRPADDPNVATVAEEKELANSEAVDTTVDHVSIEEIAASVDETNDAAITAIESGAAVTSDAQEEASRLVAVADKAVADKAVADKAVSGNTASSDHPSATPVTQESTAEDSTLEASNKPALSSDTEEIELETPAVAESIEPAAAKEAADVSTNANDSHLAVIKSTLGGEPTDETAGNETAADAKFVTEAPTEVGLTTAPTIALKHQSHDPAVEALQEASGDRTSKATTSEVTEAPQDRRASAGWKRAPVLLALLVAIGVGIWLLRSRKQAPNSIPLR